MSRQNHDDLSLWKTLWTQNLDMSCKRNNTVFFAKFQRRGILGSTDSRKKHQTGGIPTWSNRIKSRLTLFVGWKADINL